MTNVCKNCAITDTNPNWEKLSYDEKRDKLTAAISSSEEAMTMIDKLLEIEKRRFKDGEVTKEWLRKIDDISIDIEARRDELEDMLEKLDEDEEKKEAGGAK